MSEPIVMIDSSEVRPGKLEELKGAIDELVEFVDANEPLPILYHMYLSEDGTRMTVIQVHPDAASMEHHMVVADPVFAGFRDLITLSAMDVYGKPSEHLMEQLRRKADLLGDGRVGVHELLAGFARFGAH